MTRAAVLFRVDAGPQQGWEHLMRCLIVAAALQRRRRPAHFLSQLQPASLVPLVKRGGNEWLPAAHPVGGPEDLLQTQAQIRQLNAQAVVVDSPLVNQSYLEQLRATGAAVVVLDSLATSALPTHLVVNPLLGPSRDDYDYGNGTQLLLGARYALVRPEVRRIRPIRAQEPPQPFRLLIALGDDDLNNQSGELAKILLNCPRVGHVDILVRPFHPQLESLTALAASCPERLAVYSEPHEVPLRLSRCHLALTAGNAWSLELACVGIPQLLIVQTESYWPTAHRLEEEGAATCLGWHANVSASTIRQALAALLSDPFERQSMARAGRKLIDGRGSDRFVTALELILQPLERQRQRACAA